MRVIILEQLFPCQKILYMKFWFSDLGGPVKKAKEDAVDERDMVTSGEPERGVKEILKDIKCGCNVYMYCSDNFMLIS